MAKRAQHVIDEVSFYDAEALPEKNELDDIDLEKATIQHEFSSPWDDSDLILVVEEQKLHVHRLILKMASPVFKAMLSSDFKEKDGAEIPLPGKKVNEVVCLLSQIYPQFKQEITRKFSYRYTCCNYLLLVLFCCENMAKTLVEKLTTRYGFVFTVDNVECLYRLANEYQMKREMEACKNFLASVPKTRKNAINILALAKVCQANEACRQCCEVLREMSLKYLKENEILEGLDGKSTQVILLPKVEELQQCIQEALPQMLGVIGRLLYVMLSDSGETKDETLKKRAPQTCSSHGRKFFCSMESIISCESCKASWVQLATCYSGCNYSCSEIQFNGKIAKVIEKMSCLKE